MYQSTGTLDYSIEPDYGYRLVLNIEQDLAAYYFSLIPKYYDVKLPQYKAHISIVRKEIPAYLNAWGKYQNKKVQFYYDPLVHCENDYWWVDCFSLQLEAIRHELGLWYKGKYTNPPKPWNKFFHFTVGNTKT